MYMKYNFNYLTCEICDFPTFNNLSLFAKLYFKRTFLLSVICEPINKITKYVTNTFEIILKI